MPRFWPRMLLERVNVTDTSTTLAEGTRLSLKIAVVPTVTKFIQSHARVFRGGELTTARSTVTPDGIVRDFDSSFSTGVMGEYQMTSGVGAVSDTDGQMVTLWMRALDAQHDNEEFVTVQMPPHAPANIWAVILFENAPLAKNRKTL